MSEGVRLAYKSLSSQVRKAPKTKRTEPGNECLKLILPILNAEIRRNVWYNQDARQTFMSSGPLWCSSDFGILKLKIEGTV